MAIKTNADLRAEIVRQGTTVTDVARFVGLSRTTVSGRLNTPGRPSPEWAARILDAIDALTRGVAI